MHKTLSTESFLSVLTGFPESKTWLNNSDAKRSRLKHVGQPNEEWTPLTAVVFEITGKKTESSREARHALQEELGIQCYQLCQIIDAEDGQNGYSGFNHDLHKRIRAILSQCPQA